MVHLLSSHGSSRDGFPIESHQASLDQDGLPDEYFRRLAAYKRGCRVALVILLLLTGLVVSLLAWAIFGGGSGAASTVGLLTGAVVASVLLYAWIGLIGGYFSELRASPRIVPYFRGAVPGPDTFFQGEALARTCKHLDGLAAQEGVAGISNFGFSDDFLDTNAPWYPAVTGLPTFQILLQRLKEDPTLLRDPDPVIADLERIFEKLREAERLQIEFCLHLRIDTSYTGHEFDCRKGRYWE